VKDYKHGGDVTAFLRDSGIDFDDVIDLSSNINFVKPMIDVDFNRVDTSSYPNYEELYQTVSENYSISREHIELFNGATVAISSLLRFLREKRDNIFIYSPAYLEYKRVARDLKYRLFLINRLESSIYTPSPSITSPLPPPLEGSVVVFVNPSTPDGKLYDIKPLLKLWDSLGCAVVLDESFLEFTQIESASKYIDRYENLFIVKSMSKFYSSAGVRVGAVISKSIETIKSLEPLWKISSFDSTYIISALKDSTFPLRSMRENVKSKEYLIGSLRRSPFVSKIYPSRTNFILFKSKMEAKEFQDMLKPYKIMIRDCGNFDYLSSKHIRVAVKDLDSMRTFGEAIGG
jgi:threonine-phosphate decarboxylase